MREREGESWIYYAESVIYFAERYLKVPAISCSFCLNMPASLLNNV